MSDSDRSRQFTDQLMLSVLRQFNRRAFLKAAAAAALSSLPWVFGKGMLTALAITCPPDAYGACMDCYTACITGGRSCTCVCDTCNCTPLYAQAACIWTQFGSQCFFSCECIAC